MNDRLAFCDVCEDTYFEGAESEHEHPKERAAERQFLGIEQKGCRWVKIAADTYRCADWPDCLEMRFTGSRWTGPTFSSRTDQLR